MNQKQRILIPSISLLIILAVIFYFYSKEERHESSVDYSEYTNPVDATTTVAPDTAIYDASKSENISTDENHRRDINLIDLKNTNGEKFIPAIENYLNSVEGMEYDIIKNDRRLRQNLYLSDTFVQNQDGFAILLSTSPFDKNNYKEKLLVFSEETLGDVSLIYSETFYNKVLLETIFPDSYNIYMGTEETITPPSTGILIKQQDEPDAVVIYDEKFDNIHKYIQLPLSQLRRMNGGD